MNNIRQYASRVPVDQFRIRDIVLHGARFARLSQLPEEENTQIIQQSKRSVGFARTDIEEPGSERKLLHVFVGLGARLKSHSTEDVYLTIEADFIAEYELLSAVGDDLVKEFADFNAVHNVWPFWRQHVFDIVQRGRLPAVEIPLFSGMQAAASTTSDQMSISPETSTPQAD